MAGSRLDQTGLLQAESPQMESQNESPLFGEMPKDVRNANVYPHVAIDMLGLFAQTCKKAEAETVFSRLLGCAVFALPESWQQEDETKLAAIAMLNRHPELLFVKGIVTDHFGRKIFASPYQLFLGAGDTWALKQVHEEIIPNIQDGEAQAQKQFKEQFPNCELPFNPELGEAVLYDDRNKAMIAQVIVQLKTIAEAITADPCTHGEATLDTTRNAVAALREIFAPKQREDIRTGLHFPLAIMQEILRVYDVQFVPWSGAQLSFFSREVIGAALDASTAVDGQCYKTGLSNLNPEKGPDRRDGLFCPLPKGIPPELAPLKGKLGRTMFVDPYDGESLFRSSRPGYFDCYNKNGCAREGAGWCGGRWALAFLSWAVVVAVVGQLLSSKNFRLSELMRPHREEKTSRCVIC